MEYPTFSNSVRDLFDNVFAIHWKGSSLDHIRVLVDHFRNNGYRVQFYTPDSELSEDIDFSYIERFFKKKEADYPSLKVEAFGFTLNCFLEHEQSISLWFNDSADTAITSKSLSIIKRVMRDIAITFNRTVYVVNEGEATHRYKVFEISNDCIETDYDLSDASSYVEKIY